MILTFFSCVLAFGQVSAPPSPSTPTNNNRKLITKIIEVTNHEQFFIDYCTSAIKEYAYKRKWDEEKIKEKIDDINFTDYARTIYNSYSSYSETELKIILETMTIINKGKNKSTRMILQNFMMQSNLDVYVQGLFLKG